MEPSLARRLWAAVEPYHAVTYFAPECRQAMEAAGLRGFWRGYFAGRAAPLGPVPAAVVTATFFNFHPGMVARAIPDVWARATPEAATAARLAGAVNALDRLLGPLRAEEREAAPLARAAAEAADGAGRALFAAYAVLPWPDGPRAVLWHAATLLREHRGDGHVAALVAAGVDGCEAHVLAAAGGGAPAELFQAARGWSDEEWRAAAARLSDRGLVGADGLTAAGRALREDVEAATDRAAAGPWATLGPEAGERLVTLMAPLAATILAQDVIPWPNPIGLPPTP